MSSRLAIKLSTVWLLGKYRSIISYDSAKLLVSRRITKDVGATDHAARSSLTFGNITFSPTISYTNSALTDVSVAITLILTFSTKPIKCSVNIILSTVPPLVK